MKGVTYYSTEFGKFAIWQARLKDEIPGSDYVGNPLLWWSKCLKCGDYVVCGLPRKGTTLKITADHLRECEK